MSILQIFCVSEATSSKRNFGLDLLRAIAIVLVLLSHGRGIVNIPVKGLGYFGVELFFVLSGFLIGGILIKVFEGDVTFRSLYNFWLRRWFRTLPNYYLFLFASIVIALVAGWGVSSYYVRYLFFSQCFIIRVTPIMGESWSLCVEEFFYLLFPLSVLIWRKILPNKKSLLQPTLCFIAVFTVLRICVALFFPERPIDYGFRCSTILRLDAIGYGVLTAWFLKNNRIGFLKYKHVLLVAGVAGLVASYVSYTRFSLFDKTLMFSITSLSFCLIIPFFYEMSARSSITRYAVSHISIISYSLYLVHRSIVLLVLSQLSAPAPVEYFSYWFFSIALSTMVYNLYERRATLLRDRFTKKEGSAVITND